MDLGNLLAERTKRLGFAVACALGLCLIVLALLNTQAQQRQNKELIEAAARAALLFVQTAPATTESMANSGRDARERDAQAERLSQVVIDKVSRDSERLTLSHELRENAMMAIVCFFAFVAFAALLITLQKKTIRLALAPVVGMVEELEAFEAGDLDRRLPQVPLRELDSVSRSFNHLAESLQASINSQETLSRQLIEMRHQERLNLARDLHDDLGQTLTAAAIEIEAARLQAKLSSNRMLATTLFIGDIDHSNLDKIEGSLDRARQSLRQLTAQLRGEGSNPTGLDVAALLAFWKRQHPEVQWRLSCDLISQLDLLMTREQSVAYRILQESLTNVFKHSQALDCQISLSLATNSSESESTTPCVNRLELSNNGLASVIGTRCGFGIEGMRERAKSINADFRAGPEADGRWHVHLVWLPCES